MENNSGDDRQIKLLYEHFLRHPHISTDSRNINSGDVFFALKGENFDGNEFVPAALEKGASLVVFDSVKMKSRFGKMESNSRILFSENSLATLQALATYHRKHLSTTIIGISGTNGKTTTKELIQAVLSKKYSCVATKGNLNNHIGVPLTLLSITSQTEVAIVEMGANHPGEIEFLCRIAQPDMAILTNIGTAHIEGFGSYENIVKTKKALFESVKQSNGSKAHIFVNADDKALADEKYSSMTTYSLYGKADITGRILHDSPFASIETDNTVIRSRLTGSYNAHNMLAAVSIGRYMGIETDVIKEAIEAYVPSNNRSQIVKKGSNTLIMDCYNANPSSCRAALESFAQMEAKHKAVLLGAMKELGKDSEKEHEKCYQLAKSMNFERIMLVGEEYKPFAKDGDLWFENSEKLRSYLADNPISDSLILIKGSRSTKMEVVEDVL